MSTITSSNSTTRKASAAPTHHERQRSMPTMPAAAPQAESLGDRVRARAYDIYKARVARGLPGDAASDWTQAEREVKSVTPVPPASAVEREVRTGSAIDAPRGL